MDVIKAGLAGLGALPLPAPEGAGKPAAPAGTGPAAGPGSAAGTGAAAKADRAGARPDAAGADFGGVLAEQVRRQAGLRFSRHAEERLRAGGRSLSAAELAGVAEAVDRAAAKGGREALVVTGDLALVVDVRDRTVVTVVEAARMRDHVFTRIDSAVLLQWPAPAAAGAAGGFLGASGARR